MGAVCVSRGWGLRWVRLRTSVPKAIVPIMRTHRDMLTQKPIFLIIDVDIGYLLGKTVPYSGQFVIEVFDP